MEQSNLCRGTLRQKYVFKGTVAYLMTLKRQIKIPRCQLERKVSDLQFGSSCGGRSLNFHYLYKICPFPHFHIYSWTEYLWSYNTFGIFPPLKTSTYKKNSVILKMESVYFSETSQNFYRTLHNKPKQRHLSKHPLKKLKT